MLLVCAAFMLPLNAAHAASCTSLKAELRRLESGSAAQSPAARKWTSAKQQQQKAIAAAERDAGYFNCGSTPTASCKSLNSKIKRMKANLGKIERQLAKASGGSAKNTRRIRQVRASLAKCGGPAQSRQAKQDTSSGNRNSGGLFSRLFNPKSRVEQVSARTGDKEIATVRKKSTRTASRRHLPSGGKFRTVCVRTCDGYFFPISFSTGKSQFVNDEARCSEICPASETELYVYRNPGGDQSAMMSLAGDLYSEQPFAYRYKSEYVEGCSCRRTRQSKMRSSWTELTSGSGNRIFFSDISAGLPRRTLRPSLGDTFEKDGAASSPLGRTPLKRAQLPHYLDPDTRFNLEKGFEVTARLSRAVARSAGASNKIASVSLTESGLPLLSIRPGLEDEDERPAASPIFKTADDGFRPAGEERKASVRVVGPEYFVAQ